MNIKKLVHSDSFICYLEIILVIGWIPAEALSHTLPGLSPLSPGRLFRVLFLAGCLAFPFAASDAAANEVWLRVDTRDATLTVMKGDKAQTVFRNIAIGRFGKTYFKRKGDEKTPLGRFTIAWIPHKSQYHRFLGLDYPDLRRADRALVDGEITEAQWQAIRRATRAGKRPPQDTPLGGYIGIHGTGAGDPRIHGKFNWTSGCIALTNDQIDRLAQWVQLGTRVEIR
jgi:murein L,D-transpeptidase YafK